MDSDRTRHRIWPLNDTSAYDRAVEWLKQFSKEDAKLDGAYGISYYNGKIYIHDIYFRYEDDYLMFKLTFPEICG